MMRRAAALCCAAAAAGAAPPALKLSVSRGDGAFNISLGGAPWLSGGEVRVGGRSSGGGDLAVAGSRESDGHDALGAYHATTLDWAPAGSANVSMTTTFREYAADAGAIVFEQSFPAEVGAEARLGAGGLAAGTIFPSFHRPRGAQALESWSCRAGEGGSKAQDSDIMKQTTDNSEAACGALCEKTSGCDAFDFTKKSTKDACRLFKDTKSRSDGGGKDDRQYCLMSGVPVPPVTADLSCFAYHGVFPSMKTCTISDYAESNMGGAPLVIYNASDPALAMTVFSPLDHPMAHHMAHDDSFFGAGVKATVETIPAGWTQSFVLSAGAGINDGMMAWGDRMLRFSGKPRVDNRYLDDVHGGIGFWTDNGGYYHYSIGSGEGKNYEEVLPKVKAYHDALGVPFKHWQFDSWFYPKDGPVSGGGGGGAVTNWTAMDSVFPSGMVHIQEQIKLPMVMHNRQWSTKSDYIKHWTDIEWYTSSAAVPKDPARFFERFFTQQEGWGLSMYEQDWMNKEYDQVSALQKNVSMGDLWLAGMASGAAGSNRTVQYCMPYPNEVLSGAAHAAVTNARATGDYHPGNGQWAIGSTSLFYWALNILPFKDGFYSSTHKQSGGQSVGPEKHPDRETLMATLSCAMVGPMDGINLLNASRVMTTCRGDGMVLKPDRPATTTDACFRAGNPKCHVYHTYSDVSGLGRVHYYYNDGGDTMLADEVYLSPDSAEHVVYNWYTGQLSRLNASNTVAPGYEGHVYTTVTPVTDGWVFLGEVGKYVTASTYRFSSVAASGGGLTAQVRGVANETVRVCAAPAGTLQASCQDVAFAAAATKEVTFSA